MANKEATRVSAHVDRVLEASTSAAGAGAAGSAVVVVAGAGAGVVDGATVVVAGLGAVVGVATQHSAASEVAHAAPAQEASAIKAPV
jgi:hypothetical protein